MSHKGAVGYDGSSLTHRRPKLTFRGNGVNEVIIPQVKRDHFCAGRAGVALQATLYEK